MQEPQEDKSITAPVEIKGPDPSVWGKDADRPLAVTELKVPEIDGVHVKGPDPDQHPQNQE